MLRCDAAVHNSSLVLMGVLVKSIARVRVLIGYLWNRDINIRMRAKSVNNRLIPLLDIYASCSCSCSTNVPPHHVYVRDTSFASPIHCNINLGIIKKTGRPDGARLVLSYWLRSVILSTCLVMDFTLNSYAKNTVSSPPIIATFISRITTYIDNPVSSPAKYEHRLMAHVQGPRPS